MIPVPESLKRTILDVARLRAELAALRRDGQDTTDCRARLDRALLRLDAARRQTPTEREVKQWKK